MTTVTFVYEPPISVSIPCGHDTAPVRIYTDYPYPYWGQRPDDHPVPIANIDWVDLVTIPVDLMPGVYWATHVYFGKKNQPLYTCVEFVVDDLPHQFGLGKTGKHLKTILLSNPPFGKPQCPITIYCPEDFLSVNPDFDEVHALRTRLNGSDAYALMRQRYQSSIAPRVGDEPSYSIATCVVPAGETEISFTQLLPGVAVSREWLTRVVHLKPDWGALIRLKGWDGLAELDGIITGSAYPGPHGMHISYVSLKG